MYTCFCVTLACRNIWCVCTQSDHFPRDPDFVLCLERCFFFRDKPPEWFTSLLCEWGFLSSSFTDTIRYNKPHYRYVFDGRKIQVLSYDHITLAWSFYSPLTKDEFFRYRRKVSCFCKKHETLIEHVRGNCIDSQVTFYSYTVYCHVVSCREQATFTPNSTLIDNSLESCNFHFCVTLLLNFRRNSITV